MLTGTKAFDMIFDQDKFMKLHPDWKPYSHGEHDMGRKMHRTDMYQSTIEPGLIAYWSVCPECDFQLRTKKIIEYVMDPYVKESEDEFKHGDSTAYVNEIVKGGKVLGIQA